MASREQRCRPDGCGPKTRNLVPGTVDLNVSNPLESARSLLSRRRIDEDIGGFPCNCRCRDSVGRARSNVGPNDDGRRTRCDSPQNQVGRRRARVSCKRPAAGDSERKRRRSGARRAVCGIGSRSRLGRRATGRQRDHNSRASKIALYPVHPNSFAEITISMQRPWSRLEHVLPRRGVRFGCQPHRSAQ